MAANGEEEEVVYFQDIDYGPEIQGSLKDWREQNPGATVANITHRDDITDDDFVYLRGIEKLNMSVGPGYITNEAFKHLSGIHTLDMLGCNQPGITDAAFEYLRGIKYLNISQCDQITDAAFEHFVGIHTLRMQGCTKITDAAFVYLRGIQELEISGCDQLTNRAFEHLDGIKALDMKYTNENDEYDNTITDEAFKHLVGIKWLDMSGCWQDGITDAAFVHLKGIHTLHMSHCKQVGITDGAFVHLKGIHTLSMTGCFQEGITDGAFVHLKSIHTLNMHNCFQEGITDGAFAHLYGIHTLDLSHCDQAGITGQTLYQLGGKIKYLNITKCNPETILNAKQVYDVTERDPAVKFYYPPIIQGSLQEWRQQNPYARVANIEGRQDLIDADFVHLKGIHTLSMRGCHQAGITDGAFVHLKGIHTLYMIACNQAGITDGAFVHLKGIHTLIMIGCTQAGITDGAFVHLKGIHTLDMSFCIQAGITDGAFVHLKGIHKLSMWGCDQAGITDAAFVHLKGIHALNMSECTQAGITDGAFVHLKGIHTLNMSACTQAGITDGAFVHLKGIHTLNMRDCAQPGITGETLYQLGYNLKKLYIKDCKTETIVNANQVYGVTERDPTVKFYKPPEPAEMWKGFTRADANKLNTIFEEDAIEYSVCPICLVYIRRLDGCMYVQGHTCKKNARHEKLYQKYKNSEGKITWCTICSRISLGHRHYELAYSDNEKPELSTYPLDAFANDCRPSGGGLLEKLARFRRLREYALELQGDIDIKTKKQALNELVEEVWNAPLRREGKLLNKIKKAKEWNIPNIGFSETKANKNAPNAPNIPFPLNGILPEAKEHGRNNLYHTENVPILEFKHKQNDGSFKTHGLEAESLKEFIQVKVKEFGTEEFGYCFMFPHCNAKIHPQEIKDHVPEELYNEYKRRYNNKFSMVGGAENDESESENIFKEATDVECYIPTNTSDGGKRKMTRRRKYLKTRKNKGGKQKYRKTRK
jgi:hypothetical protein